MPDEATAPEVDGGLLLRALYKDKGVVWAPRPSAPRGPSSGEVSGSNHRPYKYVVCGDFNRFLDGSSRVRQVKCGVTQSPSFRSAIPQHPVPHLDPAPPPTTLGTPTTAEWAAQTLPDRHRKDPVLPFLPSSTTSPPPTRRYFRVVPEALGYPQSPRPCREVLPRFIPASPTGNTTV